MDYLYEYLPENLVTLLLVAIFSLLIGLSLRRITLKREGETTLFGTDRTFTFIGILGYLLYLLDPVSLIPFLGGGLILGILLGVNYYMKQLQLRLYGMTTIVMALITYCLPPIVATQPSWFYLTVIVLMLLMSELKHTFTELAHRMKNDEMVTLAKFIAISGIVLPMLPREPILPGINLTPYQIWLATVVVSGISYLSYLLKRYVFHESGVMVSGIIGGLYSSTATITILARKCKKATVEDVPQYAAAMLMAIAMMFLRFLIIISIFSQEVFKSVAPILTAMCLFSAAIGGYIFFKTRRKSSVNNYHSIDDDSSNPLEFKVALIFALLFVVFTLLTHYTLEYAGTGGLTLLSIVAGFSDTTPFILNLLQDTDKIPTALVGTSTMLAIVASISVNLGYALFFSGNRKTLRRWLFGSFGLVIIVNLALLLLFYLSNR